MNSTMKKLILVFLSVAAVASVFAQSGSYSSRGDGYIYINGAKQNINRVNVDVNRGGQLSIRFTGSDSDSNLTAKGRWQGSGQRISFSIESGLVSGNLRGDGAISFFTDTKKLRGMTYTGTYRGSEVKVSFLDEKADLYSNQSGTGNGNGNGNNNGNIAPTWAIGQFTGFNRSFDADVTLNIQRNGDARATIRFNNGRTQTQTGRLRNERLTLDGTQFTIRKTSRGFTSEQVDDRNNTMEYTRGSPSGGGQDGNMDAMPSWLAGTFSGRNKAYKADLEIEVQENGRVTVRTEYDGGRVQNQTGRYDGGFLVIQGVKFNVSKTWNGIRLVQQNDKSNTADYRRR